MGRKLSSDTDANQLPGAVPPKPPRPPRGFRKALHEILFNAVNDAIVLVDPQTGTFLEVNEKFCQMTGFRPQEARNLSIEVLFTGAGPFSAVQAGEYIQKALQEGPQLFEWEAQDRTGRRHWVELNLTAITIGRRKYLLGVVRDIQARKESEQRAQQGEKAMLALFNALQDVALLLDGQGRIIAANHPAAKRLRRPLAALIGADVFELLPPPLAEARRVKFNEVLQTGRVIQFEDENKGVSFLNVFYPVFDDRDQLVQVGIYALDITEDRQNKQELEKIRARLECLLNHTPAALYSCRCRDCGTLSYVSKNILHLTGFTAQAILARPEFWLQRIHPDDVELVHQKRLQGQDLPTQRLQYRFLHQDGTYRWLHDEFNLVRDKHGQPLEFIGSLLDITAAKEAQEELAFSEARYRAMVECQTDFINRFTPDFTFIYVNEAICRLFGLEQEELVGRSFLPFLTPEEQAETEVFLSSFTPAQPVQEREHRFILPDGSHRWLAWKTYAFYDDQGRIKEFQGVGRDITRRHEAEEALRQSELRFRTYVESSLVGVMVLQDQQLPYVNPALARMFGFSSEQLMAGMNVFSLVHPDDQQLVRKKIQERLAGAPPERYAVRGIRKDGSIVHCELVGNLIEYQGRPAILTTLIDISQRREAERALRESEKQFRLLVETMNDGLGIGDRDRRIVYVNPRFSELIGFTPDELRGRYISEFLDESSKQIFASHFAKRAQGDHSPYEVVWVRKDGSHFPAIVSPRPVFDQEGNFTASFAIITDITARREAEAASQRREHYFRQLTENVSDVIGLLSAQGVINYLNPISKNLLGYEPQELVGQNAQQYLHPEDRLALQKQFRRLLTKPQEPFSAVARVRHRDTSWHVLQFKGKNLLHDPVVAGVVINAQDITEQKNLEAALMRSAKKLRGLMNQIFTAQETERRRLSLELHDELGQSLTALKLQLRAIANKLRKDQSRLREDCNHMLEYINEVVENVRRLSHDLSPSLLETLGLGAGLRHLLNSFQQFYRIKENLQELDEIEAQLAPRVQIHLYRIFQELLTNIEKHARATQVTVDIGRQNDTLTISVADNGIGFQNEPSLGMSYENPGMGLSAINERILMLGGNLEIFSQKDEGTKVQVTIPLQSVHQS